MKLTINGDIKEIKDGVTLPELLIIENVEQPDMVSVQLNDEFIRQERDMARHASGNAGTTAMGR